MAKNINMTESVFRRQIRNVVHEALLGLMKENEGKPGIAPVDPKDLMDDEDNTTQIKPAVAKVNPEDLMDDEDTSDFGYPAEEKSTKFGPVAQKFQDRLYSARAEKARAMKTRREKPENDWFPGERGSNGKLIDPKEAFVEDELKKTKSKKMNADQLDLATAQAEAKYDKMMLVKAMSDEDGEENEEVAPEAAARKHKSSGGNNGFDVRLQDVADKYYDGGVETARVAIQQAMDKVAYVTPPQPGASLNLKDEDPSPKDEFGPDYGLTPDTKDEDGNVVHGEFSEIYLDAFDNYMTALEKNGGMSRAEVKEFANMVQNNPDILLTPNPYLDDEKGRKRIAAGLKAGKIDAETAKLMYRAIDELPAGESFEPNALRRSGMFDVDEIKDILRAGTLVGLKTGQHIKKANGEPIKRAIQQDEDFADEEFQDFRWHLRKALDDHMSDSGFSSGDRKDIRGKQKEERATAAAALASSRGEVYKKDNRGRQPKPKF